MQQNKYSLIASFCLVYIPYMIHTFCVISTM